VLNDTQAGRLRKRLLEMEDEENVSWNWAANARGFRSYQASPHFLLTHET